MTYKLRWFLHIVVVIIALFDTHTVKEVEQDGFS